VVYFEDWMIRDYAISMATAIVSIYTPDGFVIAADGLDLDWDTKKRMRESVQKIYPIKQDGRELAYCFTGTDRITPKGQLTDVKFDFITASLNATEALAGRTLGTLRDYAEELKNALWPFPSEALQALATYDSPPQETIVFIEGYYQGRPKRARIKFFHDGEQEPEVDRADLCSGRMLGVAPMPVLKVLDSGQGSGPLSSYRTKLSEIQTMAGSIKAAKKIVEALCDPEARSIDQRCIAIGGHIHMCKITKQSGFEWIITPLEEADPCC
jgi:hypothetical protein